MTTTKDTKVTKGKHRVTELCEPIGAMNLTIEQFTGCLLGLATGDALGAPYEGGALERLVWRLIGRTRDGCLRWTDDTQMAMDLANSLLEENGLQPDALARRFAAGYRWSRGYGPGAARVLKRIRRGEAWESASKAVFAEGSYGNGAAMRAPVLALFFTTDRDALLQAARVSAMVTHAHPLGIEGAVAMALAAQALLIGRSASQVIHDVQTVCSTSEFSERLKTAAAWIDAGETPGPKRVATTLGNRMTAPGSCPTALYVALRHLEMPFESMMQFSIECRGDVDTIGAMAGALWGIANGAERLPTVSLEARDELADIASRIFARYLESESPTTKDTKGTK